MIVVGTTDERDTCDCCGKTDLKRVVVLLDDDNEFVFFGTTCADKANLPGTSRTAQRRGKAPTDPNTALRDHYLRKAKSLDKRAATLNRPGMDSDTAAYMRELRAESATYRGKAKKLSC